MMLPEIVAQPRKGDLLLGYWFVTENPEWPAGWTVLTSKIGWRWYDGIMLDHIPFVQVVRNADGPPSVGKPESMLWLSRVQVPSAGGVE